jgi:hypothetical protein
MKKMWISAVVLTFSTFIYAECSSMPVGMDLAKSIEAKDVSKAKGLLMQYKADVKIYLDKCDQSKEKFEETSVMIHTYEDRLADVEFDLKNAGVNTDCSKVPSSVTLESAFKSKNAPEIKAQYATYKKNAENYIENCASHAEYETVYESSMFCDEMYDEWMQKAK